MPVTITGQWPAGPAEDHFNPPVLITLTREVKSLLEKVAVWLGLTRSSHTFSLAPLRIGVLLQVMERVGRFPKEAFGESGDMDPEALQATLRNHLEDMVYVVCMGLHNAPGKPPKWLISLVRANSDLPNLLWLFNQVMKQRRMEEYFQAMALLKGRKVLENQETGKETI